MTQWQENVEALTLKGQIRMPYTWTVGEIGSRFLTALRDEQKILGNRCPGCSTTFVPARKNCGKCFKDIPEDAWETLGPEGTVQTYTTVRFDYPLSPAKAPFVYALIRLDNADVDFLHVIKDDVDKIKTGSRVKPIFRDNREGKITDLDSFTLID